MKKTLLLSLFILGATSASLFAKNVSDDEQAIRAILARSAHGYTTRNIEDVLSMYQNDQLLVFDIVAPLKDCCGIKRAREKTESFFAGTVGPVTSEWYELKVTVDADLAYSTGLYHFAFTAKNGKKTDIHGRITDVWRRLDGKWTVVHEHTSVPAKLAFDY